VNVQRASRPIELGRAGWGVALLLWPRPVLEQVHHLKVDSRSVVIARILGARQLAQALLSGIRPSPEVLAMGVWVDAVHALTALGLAVADRSRARAGLTDAAVAGAWAALGYRDLTEGLIPPADHERRRDRLARTVLSIAPGGGPLVRRADAVRRASSAGR
jgi:hypothetical protein